jgi:hypothetical protein
VQLGDVAQARATRGHQQNERFGLLSVRRPAISLTDPKLRVELLAHAQHPHRLHHQRQSCVRRYCGVIVGDLDRKRKHACRAPTHGRYKTHV